jgi:hypothetical protein
MSTSVFNRALYTLEVDTKAIETLRTLSSDTYYFQVNGSPVYNIDDLKPRVPFQIHFRLLGGKGGFGSLLKSFRIHKSTNQLMCRNLSGRRLTDVKEEERLRKWIAKSAEREREKQRKKQEKYEKLKNGGRTKHEFNDPEYLRKRDIVLDETEDAIEAGVSALKQGSPPPGPSKPREPTPEVSSDSDSDFEVPMKKRKAAPVAADPKARDQEDEPVVKKPKVVKKNVPAKIVVISKKLDVLEVDESGWEKVEKIPPPKKSTSPPKIFAPIDLDSIKTVDELTALGLDHLKHALESRGLKCGGNLQERAARLFSVKGMTPDAYPKNIKAPKKK